jgi:subtilisin family serine protease
MTSYAPQDSGELFRPYTASRYRKRELLVPIAARDTIADELQAAFKGLTVREIERRAKIVRLEIVGGPDDVGTVIDEVRRRRRADGKTPQQARIPALSPVHTVTVGQPNVVGNPEDVLPRSAKRPLPSRKGTAGRDVTVAIIDTGIQEHPWLGDAYLADGPDYEGQVMVRYGNRDVLGPQAGHCVFLAGLVLRHAPAATVIVRRTADSFGQSDILDVAAAIEWAVDREADIINLSLGCLTRNNNEPWALAQALDGVPSDVAVVASAGNTSTGVAFWPGAFDRVIAVGAVENHGGWRLTDYTNYGTWVDVYVPATDVLSTYIQYSGPALYPDGGRLVDKWVDYRTGWATWTGTSMASAIWSGAIARAMRRVPSAVDAAASLLTAAPRFLKPITLVPDDRCDAEGKPRRAFDVVPVVDWPTGAPCAEPDDAVGEPAYATA